MQREKSFFKILTGLVKSDANAWKSYESLEFIFQIQFRELRSFPEARYRKLHSVDCTHRSEILKKITRYSYRD